MEQLDLSELLKRFRQGSIEKTILLKSLKETLEMGWNQSLRLNALSHLKKLNLSEEDIYPLLESLFLSEADFEIRKKSLEIMLDKFLETNEKVVYWMARNAKSLDMIGLLFRALEKYKTKTSKKIRLRIYCKYGLKQHKRFGVIPKEAVGLGLLETYLDHEFENWATSMLEGPNIAVNIKSRHVNLIFSSDVYIKEIKFLEYFPELEELEINLSPIKEIRGLDTLKKLKNWN